jgi:hypothetical protein
MRPIRVISHLAAACAPFALALSAEAQSGKPPTISNRYFNGGGSVKVTVKGSFQVEAEIPINKAASLGDGEITWIQYGVSGAEEPNLLITFQPEEMGITVGRGKRIATTGTENCKGKVEVTATVVSGQYTCPGITSHDPSARGLGKVDIEIQFTAKS